MAFARAYTAQLTMATALMLIVIQMLKATPLNMKEVHWEKVLVVKEYCSHSTSTYYLLHIQRFYIAPALGRMSYLERACAPFLDRGLSSFTVKFKFESQHQET
nr:uncharacterized protein LOC125423671 isoform X10 [Ziziphus jujuba var. spinosa]